MLKPPINNYCVYNDDVTVMVCADTDPLFPAEGCSCMSRLLVDQTLDQTTTSMRPPNGSTNIVAPCS